MYIHVIDWNWIPGSARSPWTQSQGGWTFWSRVCMFSASDFIMTRMMVFFLLHFCYQLYPSSVWLILSFMVDKKRILKCHCVSFVCVWLKGTFPMFLNKKQQSKRSTHANSKLTGRKKSSRLRLITNHSLESICCVQKFCQCHPWDIGQKYGAMMVGTINWLLGTQSPYQVPIKRGFGPQGEPELTTCWILRSVMPTKEWTAWCRAQQRHRMLQHRVLKCKQFHIHSIHSVIDS